MRRVKHGVGYNAREIILLVVACVCVLATSWYVSKGKNVVDGSVKITKNDIQILNDQVQAIYTGINSGVSNDQLVSLFGNSPNPEIIEIDSYSTISKLYCGKTLPLEFIYRSARINNDGSADTVIVGISNGRQAFFVQLNWIFTNNLWQLNRILCSV
ncbi:MAG: hypothetical protein AAB459_00455 [Patescibacteria group bacterium]